MSACPIFIQHQSSQPETEGGRPRPPWSSSVEQDFDCGSGARVARGLKAEGSRGRSPSENSAGPDVTAFAAPSASEGSLQMPPGKLAAGTGFEVALEG